MTEPQQEEATASIPGTERPLSPDATVVLYSADEVRLLDSFAYHKPSPDQTRRIEQMRWNFQSLARELLVHVAPSADRTAALRQLHEAMMTTNKAIVLDGRGEAIDIPTPAAWVVGPLEALHQTYPTMKRDPAIAAAINGEPQI